MSNLVYKTTVVKTLINMVPSCLSMKLQKQKAYKYKDKAHYKYVLVVNEKLVDALGWESGDELTASVKKGKLVVVKS